MDRRLRIVGGVLLAACWLGGGGRVGAARDARPEPPSSSVSAGELRVVERREVSIGGRGIVGLSPDGTRLAVTKARAVCAHDVETLAELSCAEPTTGQILPWSITWSPDSARIAFTEDLPRLFIDSDVWVLEVEGGALLNLTDDGASGGLLAHGLEPIEAQHDLAPAWFPDGTTLAFARTPGSREGTAIYRVPLDGGDPEKLLDVAGGVAYSVLYGPRWSEDGAMLVYTVAAPSSRDPNNGLWVADRDGRDPRQVVKATGEDGPPLLLDVTPDGAKALDYYWQAAERFAARPNASPLALVDLQTGAVQPIKRAAGDAPEFFGPSNAALSPDGSKVLYAYRHVDGEHRLAVRDLDGGDEHVLAPFDRPVGSIDLGHGLDWAADDRVYVGLPPRAGLLLKLEARE